MRIQQVAAKYEEYVVEKRRLFHMYPEVSAEEYGTSKMIQEELDAIGIPWVPCGLRTGILATIQGGKPGKTILLRGDIDALSVQETTDAPYASKTPGMMHACGHDCHIAMMLTAGRILWDLREELCGTVKLAFQPAEEIAQGARSMIEEGILEGVEGCFALHVWTDVEAGKISLEPGPRMASADQFIIHVRGAGCHGAQPERGVDAAVVTAAIINNLQTIVSREISPMDPAVITVGTIECGSRWNVVPENSTIMGTTRCFSPEVWASFDERMDRMIQNTAAAYRAEAKLDYIRLDPPTVNDAGFVDMAQQSARKILGEDCLSSVPPTTAGEDMSYFFQRVPGAIGLLGTGNPDCGAIWPNHSGNFCVDESALIKGAMLYAQVAMDFNSQE